MKTVFYLYLIVDSKRKIHSLWSANRAKDIPSLNDLGFIFVLKSSNFMVKQIYQRMYFLRIQ